MLASDVLDRARLLLQDESAVRWLDTEQYRWLTDGQRVIVLVRPDACVANVQITLVAGTKQSLPAGALRLLDVVRNVPVTPTGASTPTSGRAVRLVDREVLDTQNPNWHFAKPALVIRNYVYDNRDPLNFYVSPPATAPDPRFGSAKLEIIHSKLPAAVVALTDTLTIPDIYMDPLLNYVMFRSYSKDAQFAQNAQLASAYMTTFMAMLGVKTKHDVAYSPDLHSKGALPDSPALQMEGV